LPIADCRFKSLPIADCRLPIGFLLSSSNICDAQLPIKLSAEWLKTNRHLAIGNRQWLQSEIGNGSIGNWQ
jgi:hypothetical protein